MQAINIVFDRPPSNESGRFVELELAKAVGALPGRNGLAGGSRYELNYDGYLH